MAEADYPSGDLDATNVTVTYGSGVGSLLKRRQVVSLADPYVADARIRLASVDGAYRVPVSEVPNKISTTSFNSRAAATLAAAGVFQGVGEDVSMYGRAGIAIRSDNATDGTLTIEVSHDGVNWSGPTRDWADTRFAQPVMWNIVEKYFRVKYVNGTTEAENLSIQTQYSNNADIFLAHPIDETLIDETQALATRAVLVGKDSDGSYRNINSTLDGKLKVETDEFANLQSEMLAVLQRIDQRLEIISGYEMIKDSQEDL